MPTLMEGTNPIAGLIPDRGSVSVTADGVKTRGQLLNELFSLIDPTKINVNSKLERKTSSMSVNMYGFISRSTSGYGFSLSLAVDNNFTLHTVIISSTSAYWSYDGTTITNASSMVDGAGITYTLYY